VSEEKILVPDIGTTNDVEVIEVLVAPGDKIAKDTSLITLESDKASMEIPSPLEGTVKDIKLKVGDKVSQGKVILTINTEQKQSATKTTAAKQPESQPTAAKVEKSTTTKSEQDKKNIVEAKVPDIGTAAKVDTEPATDVHAGPGVRRLARELGVDIHNISGTGEKNRVTYDDIHTHVKNLISGKTPSTNIPVMPAIDFSKFGDTETTPLSKIKRLTGINLHRSWVTVPHVTQFDEADITELEEFRNATKAQAEKQGFKLTPIVFIMKAVVACLKKFPTFNSSLDATGENLILKKYFHLGVAVDTPNGLVVPVIHDVDKKGMFELADELAKLSKKARDKGLMPADMQGSCFTISSLGGIGGTAFTPIVNMPDVAILGVSKAIIKPVYQDKQFVPRLMLPLSLSYDHRVIDGAEAARFTTTLAKLLEDVRQLLL
jgi:pyruvate dehydrogenase E2 component (dihydrolipoamide acetyltransferase)